MLSGESAVGDFPVKSVEMLVKIAKEVEKDLQFVNHPPAKTDETHALSEALNAIDKILDLRYIVTFTSTGYTSQIAAGERPRASVIAFTPNPKVYHRLNLIWGVIPILIEREVESFEDLVKQAETYLLQRNLASPGDLVLIMAGIPTQKPRGTNFLKVHKLNQ
jgi:pyruvate kinase